MRVEYEYPDAIQTKEDAIGAILMVQSRTYDCIRVTGERRSATLARMIDGATGIVEISTYSYTHDRLSEVLLDYVSNPRFPSVN